jgi:hypothetical protein
MSDTNAVESAATQAPAETPTVETNDIPQPVGNDSQSPTTGSNDTPPKEGEIKKESSPDNPEKPFVLKVNGKEIHVSTREEAVKLMQKGINADQRQNEAFRMKQQVETFIHTLKTDPLKILNDPNLGLDMKKLAQEFLAKEIEKEMMTPEQRENLELREKIRQAEEDKKSSSEKEHQERMQKLVEHYNVELEKDIISTLQSSGLPNTRGTVRRIAYYMQKGLERGVELKASEVIDYVRKDIIQEHNELYGASDGDTLLKMFSEPVMKKLLEANLRKVKGGDVAKIPTQQPKDQNAVSSNQPEKMDKEEWRKKLDAHVAAL